MSARLSDVLERAIPLVLDEWGRHARTGELEALCDTDLSGDLAEVLRTMAAALRPLGDGEGAVDEFIETAAGHGARRRAQGVGEGCLFEEYDLLGSLLPVALRNSPGVASLAPEDLVAIEGGLTTAILAGLRGYHRGEFERRGAWPETLARAVSEASELSPRRPDTQERQS